jgi:hypothetical protein
MEDQIENLRTGKINNIYILTYLIQNKKLKAPTQKTKIKKYAFKMNGLLI